MFYQQISFGDTLSLKEHSLTRFPRFSAATLRFHLKQAKLEELKPVWLRMRKKGGETFIENI
jgi:hypothetical protein